MTLTHLSPVNIYAKEISEYFIKNNYKRIALFQITSSGAQLTNDEIKKYIKDNNLPIEFVFEEKFNAGTRDFRTPFQKANSLKPDIFFFLSHIPENYIILNQYKELGIKKPINGMFFDLKDYSSFQNIPYLSITEPTLDFNEKYTKRFGHPVDFQAGNSYDIFNLIVDSYENIKNSTPEDAVSYLKTSGKKFQGAMGSLEINKAGVVISQPVWVKAQNEKKILLDKP
jgi:ABC-type branched-subunit amino acid transport system substrate-binding protein